MSASSFEQYLFHEKLGTEAADTAHLGQLQNSFHQNEMGRVANEIENKWNIYFLPKERRPPEAAAYLRMYREINDPQKRSMAKGILSTLAVYLRDKEMLSRKLYTAYEARIKELQVEYAKNPKNEKLRKELVYLIKQKGKLIRDLKFVSSYKTAFEEVGINYKAVDNRMRYIG